MFPGKGPEDLTPTLLLRLPAGGKKNIVPQLSAPGHHQAGPTSQKLGRSTGISELRCLNSQSTAPDTDAFMTERWSKQGKHTPVNTSRAPKAHDYETPAVRPCVKSFAHHRARQIHTEAPATNKHLAPVDTSCAVSRSPRNHLSPASHPHPLRSQDPWPGHLETCTARPRRRGRLFSQAEKDELNKRLFPAAKEVDEGEDKDQTADEAHVLASARNIISESSIVVCEHDAILAVLHDWRSQYQRQYHRNKELEEVNRSFLEENHRLSSRVQEIISELAVAKEQLECLRRDYEVASETLNALWAVVRPGLPRSERVSTAADIRGFIRDLSTHNKVDMSLAVKPSVAHGEYVTRPGQTPSLPGCHLDHRRLSADIDAVRQKLGRIQDENARMIVRMKEAGKLHRAEQQGSPSG